MPDWIQQGSRIFLWLFGFKVISTGIQIYLGSLIATNGSAQEPWLNLTTIAHMGAITLTLRGIDALIDPAFQRLNPLKKLSDSDRAAIAAETTSETK